MINMLNSIQTINLGIYLNFYWVLYTLSLQLVWLSCWHVNNFAENLQYILPLPGLAQCDGSYPSHLDFNKQQNERENEKYLGNQ